MIKIWNWDKLSLVAQWLCSEFYTLNKTGSIPTTRTRFISQILVKISLFELLVLPYVFVSNVNNSNYNYYSLFEHFCVGVCVLFTSGLFRWDGGLPSPLFQPKNCKDPRGTLKNFPYLRLSDFKLIAFECEETS